MNDLLIFYVVSKDIPSSYHRFPGDEETFRVTADQTVGPEKCYFPSESLDPPKKEG